MPDPIPTPAISEQPIEVGQVWEHHSTGRYVVYRVDTDGRVAIKPTPSDQERGARIWQSYMCANFRLVSDA